MIGCFHVVVFQLQFLTRLGNGSDHGTGTLTLGTTDSLVQTTTEMEGNACTWCCMQHLATTVS